MKWECIKSCQWGVTPKSRRFYVVGDVIDTAKQPNRHFIKAGEARIIVKKSLTKDEINAFYDLNLSPKEMKIYKKAELIEMAEG